LRILNNLSTQVHVYTIREKPDVASSQNRVAEDKARELKILIAGCCSQRGEKPLRSKARAEAEEAKIIARHQAEREKEIGPREYWL